MELGIYIYIYLYIVSVCVFIFVPFSSLSPTDGVFGAMMQVNIVNNGPVTIVLDSHARDGMCVCVCMYVLCMCVYVFMTWYFCANLMKSRYCLGPASKEGAAEES